MEAAVVSEPAPSPIKVISLLRNQDKQWSVRLIARNGEIVMVSEAYTRKADARRAARWIRSQLSAHVEII